MISRLPLDCCFTGEFPEFNDTMKPSREPYGKCACAFTDGFTLTFPSQPTELQPTDIVLRFDSNWFEHFAPQAHTPSALSLFPVRRRA